MQFSSYNLPFVRNAICGLLLMAIGSLFVPLPQFRYIEKDQAIAFPCQDRACGCRTAEDCWANCCCYSDQEKVSWAAANGVKPPQWFRPIVDSPTKVTEVAKLDEKANPCCCCESAADCEPPTDSANTKETPEQSTGVVLRFLQQKCRGDLDYLSSRIILTFDRPVIEDEQLSEPLIVDLSSIVDPLMPPPPTPPPRRLLIGLHG